MTSKEKRQAFHNKYATIIGRNNYDQNKRNYCYKQYSNGKYYSDCSSSICLTYDQIGEITGTLNTAGMYYSSLFQKVNVSIKNGHIVGSDFNKLRVGDALMFAGNDPSRPKQIGHVEAIYELGSNENSSTLCGHGSGTPSLKNMKQYLTSRYNSIASNGVRKGLVCVLRRISDDGVNGGSVSIAYSISTSTVGLTITASSLNIRNHPKTGTIIGSYKSGDKVFPTDKVFVNGEAWFKTDKGYISAKYLEGWVQELSDTNKRWWYLIPEYSFIKSDWLKYNNKWYYFDKDGWMSTYCYIKSKTGNLYYWVNSDGIWEEKYNTSNPDLDKYKLAI